MNPTGSWARHLEVGVVSDVWYLEQDSLQTAPRAARESLPKNVPVLGLGRTAMSGGAHLQRPDDGFLDAADHQLCHAINDSIPPDRAEGRYLVAPDHRANACFRCGTSRLVNSTESPSDKCDHSGQSKAASSGKSSK